MKNLKITKKFIVLFLIQIFSTQSFGHSLSPPVFFQETGYSSFHLQTAPRSLAQQRLISSAFPDEAEIFCGYQQCLFGLTRGLVIGSDLFGMAGSLFRQYFDSDWNGGQFSLIDIFGGFQILKDVDRKTDMNAQIGYRRLAYKSAGNFITTQGITASLNYSQQITPIYLQSISFFAYFSGNASTNNAIALSQASPLNKDFSYTARYFYRSSQKYPTYWVSFPADIEVANWSQKQTNLNSPVHLYAHLEPFYAQNNLNFIYNNISLQKTEQNFGLRFGAKGSYESTQKTQTGRFALLGGLGLDFTTSSFFTVQSGNANLNLPNRHWLAPYVDFGGSWQF